MFFKKISEKQFVGGLIVFNFALRLFRLGEPVQAYFDEKVYYLPAARAYLAGKIDPNFEHPPLAKELIAIAIKIFGDNPFGWRVFEVVAATIGVVAIYFLTKRLFGGRLAPTLAAVLLTFEFSWFTTGRVAIPEIFMASFLLVAVYFLYSFVKLASYRFLIVGSVFFGLAVASKWTALLFLPVYLLLLVITFKKQLVKIVLPLVILLTVGSATYLATYTPYLTHHSLTNLFHLQQKMFAFHTNEQEIKVRLHAHSQGQRGYPPLVWPVNYIYSFYTARSAGQIAAILFFFNPLILWGSLLVCVRKIYTSFKKKIPNEETFLIASFLIFWLAWFLAPRNSYPYYWLAGVPFGIVLLARFGEQTYRKDRFLVLGVLLAIVLSFLFFYPLLSAFPVPEWYLRMLTGGS